MLEGTFIHIESDAQYIRLTRILDRNPAEFVPLSRGDHAYLIYPTEMERIDGQVKFQVAAVQSSYNWTPADPTNCRERVTRTQVLEDISTHHEVIKIANREILRLEREVEDMDYEMSFEDLLRR